MVHLTKRISFHTRSNRQITYNCLEIVLYFTKLCAKRNRPNVSKRSIFIIVRIFSFFKSSSLLNSLRLFFFSPFLRVEKLVKEWDSHLWGIRLWKKISKNIVENWRKGEVNEVTLARRLHRKHFSISSVFESRFNFYAIVLPCNIYIVA